MIKELFLAMALGAILGLGITGGYLNLRNKNKTESKAIITQPTIIPSPTESILNPKPKEINNDQLVIDSPEDNLLVSTDTIDIVGTTINNSQIIINTATQTFIGQSNDNGNFKISVELNTGLNVIKISSIDNNGNQLDTEISITYSTAKI